MSDLSDQLSKDTNSYFEGDYVITEGKTVPDVGDIALGKVGREMELAMMFVDIRESTKIVDAFRRVTAAKMYKSFLAGVSRIARANSGYIRSFNGDGVLVVFDGENKRTNATECALKIAWFIREILRPKLKKYFESNQKLQDVEFNFGIGIDVGRVLIVRAGIRGDNNNDLVWVGNATNKAVKLSDLTIDKYNVYISKDVYSKMADSSKLSDQGVNMWEKRIWTKMNNEEIYRSHFSWVI